MDIFSSFLLKIGIKNLNFKNLMKLWTVRAGRQGQQEQACLDEKIITIGWNDLQDLKQFKTRDSLFAKYQEIYKNDSNIKAGITVGQIWRFVNEIAIGDIVALPSKFQPVIHIGKITGDYHYGEKEGIVHWRPVSWLSTIPRVEFDQDLLYSFGSLLTVSQVSRVKSAERVVALTEGNKIPTEQTDNVSIDAKEDFNVERFAKDQIIKVLDQKFRGHDFAKLVEQILKA